MKELTKKKVKKRIERFWTPVNYISIARMAVAPLFLYFLLEDRYYVALVLFFFGVILDGLDGYVARKFDLVSRVGAILDAVADKVLLLAAVIGLIIKIDLDVGRLLIIFSKDIFVVGGIIFVYLLRKGKKITIQGRIYGKANIVLQYLTIGIIILDWPYVDIFIAAILVTAVLAIMQYYKEAKKEVLE